MSLNRPKGISAAASGRRSAFYVIAGVAALFGLSLLVLGLAERPSPERLSIELALIAPLLSSIGWKLLGNARRNWRTHNSIKRSPSTNGS